MAIMSSVIYFQKERIVIMQLIAIAMAIKMASFTIDASTSNFVMAIVVGQEVLELVKALSIAMAFR